MKNKHASVDRAAAFNRASPSAMPAFARAIRGLVHVPKAEVDAAIAKEKAAKKQKKG